MEKLLTEEVLLSETVESEKITMRISLNAVYNAEIESCYSIIVNREIRSLYPIALGCDPSLTGKNPFMTVGYLTMPKDTFDFGNCRYVFLDREESELLKAKLIQCIDRCIERSKRIS